MASFVCVNGWTRRMEAAGRAQKSQFWFSEERMAVWEGQLVPWHAPDGCRRIVMIAFRLAKIPRRIHEGSQIGSG